MCSNVLCDLEVNPLFSYRVRYILHQDMHGTIQCVVVPILYSKFSLTEPTIFHKIFVSLVFILSIHCEAIDSVLGLQSNNCSVVSDLGV